MSLRRRISRHVSTFRSVDTPNGLSSMSRKVVCSNSALFASFAQKSSVSRTSVMRTPMGAIAAHAAAARLPQRHRRRIARAAAGKHDLKLVL